MLDDRVFTSDAPRKRRVGDVRPLVVATADLEMSAGRPRRVFAGNRRRHRHRLCAIDAVVIEALLDLDRHAHEARSGLAFGDVALWKPEATLVQSVFHSYGADIGVH